MRVSCCDWIKVAERSRTKRKSHQKCIPVAHAQVALNEAPKGTGCISGGFDSEDATLDCRQCRVGLFGAWMPFSRFAIALDRTHCKRGVKRTLLTSGGEQEATTIPERDVYRLVLRSKRLVTGLRKLLKM